MLRLVLAKNFCLHQGFPMLILSNVSTYPCMAKMGGLQFMTQVLKPLFPVTFILLQHFNFCLPLFYPFFHILPYFINTFCGKIFL